MRKKNLKSALQYLLCLIVIVAAYILQAAIFCELPISGAKPLILPVAAVCVASFCGPLQGGIFGLIAGLMCDAALCRPAILFTLMLTAAGIAVGLAFEKILTKGFPSVVFCCAVVLIVSAVCQMLGIRIMRGSEIIPMLATAIYQTVYSIVFSIPAYVAVRGISRMRG